MADLIIKPSVGTDNKLIIQNQAGNAVLTTDNSGVTLTNANLANANNVYPAGHVRQVKVHSFSNYSPSGTDFSIPNTTGVGFDSVMSNSSNNVVLFFSVNFEQYSSATDGHIYAYWNGGSFPSLQTSSANRFIEAALYGHAAGVRTQHGATEVDTNPGSTNPLYSVRINYGSSSSSAVNQARLVLMEISP